MHIPSCTYRIQLNKDFTLKDLRKIIPYLHELGVSTLYASPVTKAAPGSAHGYDVVDPHAINPEIGSLEDLRAIAGDLREKGMTWLQDIVPNHMAFNPNNFRLMDVMERGPASPYARYFDIDWQHPSPALSGKLMAPFLGDTLQQCLKDGSITLVFQEQGFMIHYFDHRFPLSLPAYSFLARCCQTMRKGALASDFKSFERAGQATHEHAEWIRYKAEWVKSLSADPSREIAIREVVEAVNDDLDARKELLSLQHYTLTEWKRTEKEINYRRFFTVNGLICLRMEDEAVFHEYHRMLHALFQEGMIQGLRIDHIDGLYDPSQYVRRLRSLFGPECYIIAEKILEEKEEMPEHWPLEGASGYEFLAYASQLFTDRRGARKLERYYRELVPQLPRYEELVYANKKMILERHMAGEWDNLVRYFFALNLNADFEPEGIRQALAQLMLALPVYRIYPERLPLKGESLVLMKTAFGNAGSRATACKRELDHLQSLIIEPPAEADLQRRIILFLKRLMQFTGPITAKGVEDTTFYIYNPLISHDEVGDAPSTLGISIQEFHTKMLLRQELTPLSLNATATHDTKRGEDARLRLNVLSTLPEAWQERVSHWFTLNERFVTTVKGRRAPQVNDEYFIYQSIVGGFPEDFTVTEEWIQRLKEYLLKAAREAKVNSSWESPDEEYEEACARFVEQVLHENHVFREDLGAFMKRICAISNFYAMGQALIKVTVPGIPDVYQGCELWDLSFVDPDNRRPVDYDKRVQALQHLAALEKKGEESFFSFLRSDRDNGTEKLFVLWKALNFRKENTRLFTEGVYVPVQVTEQETKTLAYARQLGEQWTLVIVPLKVPEDRIATATYREALNDFYVILPANAPDQWRNVFTGEVFSLRDQSSVEKIFNYFPVALFKSEDLKP